ncbi:hypothetical protein [Haloarcula onubensis]|uniref:Domain of unknown function domain-containing protein n=1 Tax=Haloarcula onubensis TaxID=2950539 RepID=A0ABU2FVE6_9EURY|nr:hypothetical protein [Halomicroarcula sp. S3CR25-11]MDS0284744.1 hypothetical protein [Halomicroarcula sp. S3CR25-11]
MSGDNETEDGPWIDRPQGLLTATERDVLRSGEQFEARGREARARVRRRLRDSVLDYVLLDEYLPQKDMQQVFGWDETDPSDMLQLNVAEALKAQVRFAYHAAKTANLDPEKLIGDAVDEAKGVRIEKLVQKKEETPEELTLGEVQTLLGAGALGHEESQELISADATSYGGMVSEDEAGEELGQKTSLEDDDS